MTIWCGEFAVLLISWIHPKVNECWLLSICYSGDKCSRFYWKLYYIDIFQKSVFCQNENTKVKKEGTIFISIKQISVTLMKTGVINNKYSDWGSLNSMQVTLVAAWELCHQNSKVTPTLFSIQFNLAPPNFE